MEPATKKKKKKSRPAKRNLVRWCDDLDKQVLLTVQWACAENGIKIPWAKVAAQMGPGFTEGAIVQHLAKLRQRLVEAAAEVGTEVSIPPALRRGAVTKQPSSIYAIARGRKTIAPPPAMIQEIPDSAAAVRRSVKANRSSRRKRAMSEESDDESLQEELYDSESDYARIKTKSRAPVGKRARRSVKDRIDLYDEVDAEADERQAAGVTGPIMSAPQLVEASPLATTRVETPTVKGDSVIPSVEDPAVASTRTRGVAKYVEDDEGDELNDEKEDDTEVYGSGLGIDNIYGKWKGEEEYSPRNTTNMVTNPANFLITSNTAMPGVVQMPVANRSTNPFNPSLDLDFGRAAYPAQTYHSNVRRNSGYLPSPQSNSFGSMNSSRTVSMNSGMMMNQMQMMQHPPAMNGNVGGAGNNFNFGGMDFAFNGVGNGLAGHENLNGIDYSVLFEDNNKQKVNDGLDEWLNTNEENDEVAPEYIYDSYSPDGNYENQFQ